MYRVLLAIACLALANSTTASEIPTNILVSGYVTGVGGQIGSIGSIARFDQQGEFQERFGADRDVYMSIAAHGDTIYVAKPFDFIERFSRHGDFLGYLGPTDATGQRAQHETTLETDSRGAVYSSGSGGARQFNADGTLARVLSVGPRNARAADADSAGNIYVEGFTQFGDGTSGLYKYDPTGNVLGFVPHAAERIVSRPDMAIDEVDKVMYLTDGLGALEAYDISGPLPVLSQVIPTPGPIFGLSFDAISRHLFVTQDTGIRVWELALDGTTIRRFRVNADEGTFFHTDVAVLAVPEPLTAMIVAPLLLGLQTCRRRIRGSAAR